MKLINLLKEISTGNAVTEEGITSAIESLNAVAEKSGFKLFKKNTKPGKARTVHAMWILKQSDAIIAPYVSLTWSKEVGMQIVAQPTKESTIQKSPNGYVYGTPEEWSNPKKWEEIK